MAILQQDGRILTEEVPFAPPNALAEIYGLARNVVWKDTPDNQILAAEMKIKA